MDPLPLTQLRALAAIFSFGGIRPAARQLGISHAVLSRHLAFLEQWVGSQLYERRARQGLVFTPAGEALGRAAIESFDALERAVQSVRQRRAPNSVAVATTHSVAARWLFPRLPLFWSLHPTIDVSVFVNARVSDPAAQLADVAIRMGEGPWEEPGAEPLMDEWLYPVMSVDYWERSGRPADPASLGRLRLLHDADPTASWPRWTQHYPLGSIDLSKGPRYTSSDLVLRAAGEGLGIALARHRLVQPDLESGILVRPFGDRAVHILNAYWLVLAKDAQPRHALATFVAWLKEQGRSAAA